MSVIRRYPPFVDGDGSSTIAALIDKENEIRKQMELFPVIHPIPKNNAVKKYLKKSNLTFDSIPHSGQRIQLFNRISLAPGGVIEVIDKKTLPPENQELFTNIVSLFDANILGIDAIFEDGIEKSFTKQRCILLEVNSRPYLKMHDVPRFGEKEDLSRYYDKLDSLVIDQSDIF